MKIKHKVWPTPAPPVHTFMWNQDSWDQWADNQKPDFAKGYKGGDYDQDAWNAYLVEIGRDKPGYWKSD